MTFTDADHLFITRTEVRSLLDLLRRIPGLAEELAITETKQGRVSRPGLASPRRPAKRGAQLPVHLGAYLAAEALRQHLSGWVRAVCEQRALEVPPVDDMVGAARWLDKNVIALAMTEGAEVALNEIRAAVRECDRQIDLPPDDEIVIDPERLRAANLSVLTAYGVEKIAGQLGLVGKGLNRDRVRTLRKHGGLRECDRDGETHFYRLGDVLAAHLRHKTRQRASGKGKAA